MLVVRALLAVALLVCGTVIVVRVGAFGVRTETLPGIVLGIAMVALGVHRLSLIARVRRDVAR